MRDRAFVDHARRRCWPATAVIDDAVDARAGGVDRRSAGERQRMARAELEQAIADRRDRDELLAEYESLASAEREVAA